MRTPMVLIEVCGGVEHTLSEHNDGYGKTFGKNAKSFNKIADLIEKYL